MGSGSLGLAVLLSVPLLATGSAAEAPAPAPIEIRGMTFVSVDVDERRVVVWAERATINEGAEWADLDEVTVRVADADDTLEMRIRSDRARVDLRTEGFRLDGNVRAQTGRGRRVRATWLAYDGAAGRFFSHAPVVVEDEDTTTRGGALTYDVAARTLRVTGGARVEQRR